MKVHHISFDKVEAFSDRDIAYQLETKRFEDFYQYEPTLDGLKQAMKDRGNYPIDRQLLVDVINGSYDEGTTLSTRQSENLECLSKPNTYTVITAHQPSLFTGPLYYILKIFSCINLAEELNRTQSEYKVVPVFINGSEDHDFEEIDHLKIYGKEVKWDREAAGPVGRMNLEGLEAALEEFGNILGDSDNAKKIKERLQSAFEKSKTYNEFVFKYVNDIFADYGVLVVGSDDPRLKSAFAPIMKEELLDQPSESLVKKTQQELEDRGFKSQAFPREINLFYLTEGRRDRIIQEGDSYLINDTDKQFTQEEILDELESHPERFSPNVVLRPLYQESIFPNIAYVGGGGELAYWLERKEQFAHFKVFYPTLIRRNSAMVLSKSQEKQLDKLGLSVEDIFKPEYEIINQFLEANTTFDFDLQSEKEQIASLFESIASKARQADQSLGPFAESEGVKSQKQLDQIEGRIKRAIKNREDISVNKIKKIKDQLFPSGGLQERTDNFFQFYMTMGEDVMIAFKENLNPLKKEMLVFVDE